MQPQEMRPWYKKKRYLLPIAGILGLGFMGGGSSEATLPVQAVPTALVQPQTEVFPATTQEASVKSAIPSTPKKEAFPTNSELSNETYYTNTYGNSVHSPAYSDDDSVPQGASAQCRDGTYSFSQSRRGTCSQHGGVASWL